MTRRRTFLLLLLPAGLAACSRSSAEERLRERIKAMQQALQEQKTKPFMAGVSEDFVGSGGLDHAAVRGLLRLQFLRNARIGVTLGPLDVTLQGEEAQVAFTAVLTGGDGGLLPARAGTWQVRSGWRDGKEGWQVLQASWEPVL